MLLIKGFGKSSIQQGSFYELFSNIILFVIAIVSFLWAEFSAKKDECYTLKNTLSNLAISVIAFLINIGIFEHTIRLNYFWADLKGWHLIWLLCAVLQIFLLSDLWYGLRIRIVKVLQWGKNTIQLFFVFIKKFVSSIEIHDKKIACIITVAFVVWIFCMVYFGCHVREDEISVAGFLLQPLLSWVDLVIIGFLVYVCPDIYNKCRKGIEQIDDKKFFIAMGSVFVIIAMCRMLPSMMEVLGGILLFLVLLVVFVYGIMKSLSGEKAERFAELNDEKNWKQYIKYTVVLVCALGVMPYTILLVATAISTNGAEIHLSELATIAKTLMLLMLE